MENLSAEVGHKMRSAVKAKLVEMGSGGNSGYIDDELPDYVMIMVANKRSKAQMTEDLGLFLADNTGEFVEWLHQVLQKLQEVAIPSSAVLQKSIKRKPSSGESKRDKKKKSKRGQLDDGSTTPPVSVSPPIATEVSAGTATPSITDVFAEHLIQKARTSTVSLDNVKTKNECDPRKTDEFDIPTISEIAETAVISHNRRKDLSALADLQKKINQAKRQLRTFGSVDESEDEDFINIKDDGDDLVGADEEASGTSEHFVAADTHKKSHRTPITFQEDALAAQRRREQAKASEGSPESSSTHNKRTTVMDRLGSRQVTTTGNRDNIISLSANRRMEKEIYVPVFRRTDDNNRLASSRDASRDTFREVRNSVRTTNRDRPKDSVLSQRDSDRSAVRNHHDKAPVKHSSASSQRDLREQVIEKQTKAKELESHRLARHDTVSAKKSRSIESHVFVAPPKPAYDENLVVVPVNSVVKVQPRPVVASSKQACKNLLLRAVAEARKSTASVKPREETPTRRKPADASLPKLYSKSYRDKVKHNIVIELNTANDQFADESSSSEVEYVVDDIGCHEIDDDTEEDKMDEDADDSPVGAINDADAPLDADATQFVVTLDDLKNRKFATKAKGSKKVIREYDANLNGVDDPDNEDSRSSLKVNKLIIQNDTDDEEELMNEVKRSTAKAIKVPQGDGVSVATIEPENSESLSARRTKRRHVSPIKFDLQKEATVEEDEYLAPSSKRRANSNERAVSSSVRHRSEERSSESSKVITKRSEGSKKYDHIPSLSSAITSTDDHHLPVHGGSARHIIKSTDRCKFYPSCGKGDNCEFTHPLATSCKQFPNCKFGDTCLYFHPKCKFDMTCNRHGCNFSHSLATTSIAPPLSSHVVPVTNYKSITNSPQTTMCRFYPKCTNPLCNFYHPKPCRFGRNCTNKHECIFYHAELAGSNGTSAAGLSLVSSAMAGTGSNKDKMKWFASSTVY